MLRERPVLLPAQPGDVEPRFEVYRFDADAGERAWMTAWASELTEAEIAALDPEEQSAVRAALETDDPAIGAVHNSMPAPETLAECEAAAAE